MVDKVLVPLADRVQAGAGPAVVLTREAGKNGELSQRLRERSIEVLELPLVETGPGPDRCAPAVCTGRISVCHLDAGHLDVQSVTAAGKD